ncbi:MAG: hypothetical protein KJO10_06660 [Gammaproteobacteria bacterium]|nr:hypothetical protein [Gammaproteobacteria bacterium]
MLAMLGSPLLPGLALSQPDPANWQEFLERMYRLAQFHANDSCTPASIAEQGLQSLQHLDVESAGFRDAVENAWESGNRFWLWQRLANENGLQGGILQVDRGHDVPLHDHPGATGMLRVLTGTLEVWHFNEITGKDKDDSVLQRVSRRTLQPGDTAVLLPEQGNIHALRALSPQCSMLDFFIPPYKRSQRNWYLPAERGWHDKQHIHCERIADNDFFLS